MSSIVAVQDAYPDDYSHCFGCGRLNHAGHQLKTRLEGDETVSRFTPKAHDMALPGYVYGGPARVAPRLSWHGDSSRRRGSQGRSRGRRRARRRGT